MVFGVVEGDASGHWRSDVLGPVLRPVSVDIDMQAGGLNVVALLALGVVVVPDDLAPLLPVSVLKLDDELCDLPAIMAVAEWAPSCR